MTNITANAHTFWINHRGAVEMLTRLDWKKKGEVGLHAVDYAQDESGAFFGRANIPGRDMIVFGPWSTLRDLKKDVIRWSQGEGVMWHFRSPGSFLPDALHGELQIDGITASRFAGEINVNDRKVRQWLAGRAEPSDDELQRLCAALGVFPSDIERR